MDTNQINMKIEGLGTITNGTYGDIKVEGVGKIKGDIKFQSMSIEGTCNASGKLLGSTLTIEGLLKVYGDIKVKTLDVQGLLRTGEEKIYADEIRVEGLLKNSGEVSADKVLIEGCINMNDLFGDQITINYGGSSHGGLFFGAGFHLFGAKNTFSKWNKANNIECSNLKASNLTCHSISAYDIELHDHCIVDAVYCDGSLTYDSSCQVKHIEGDCLNQK